MPNDFQRDPLAGVNAQFWQRRSPRVFKKTHIDTAVTARLIDAARWTPSCFNEQPWRFYTSTPENFDEYLQLLVDGNQTWAKEAALLGFMVAKRTLGSEGSPNPFARFDAGAAWMAMTLQANHEGLHTHGMGGIHYDKVAEYLSIDTEAYDVILGFAVGEVLHETLLTDDQRTSEQPNGRLPLASIWCAGA